jgi:hypothetical protein
LECLTIDVASSASCSQNTRSYVVVVLAQVSGIVVTLIVKMTVMILLRQKLFAAFYRKRPGAANIMLTVLECWNVGLSTLYMITRSVVLILITALFIARIDTPMLAPGVGQIGPILLDGGPFAFCKDLLIHDAHRHPYIERLGYLYLLKLRYGDSFASRAGSCWRLLFTMALMPWLRKYRILSLKDSLGDHTSDKEQTLEAANKLLMNANHDQSAGVDTSAHEAVEHQNKVLQERIVELEEEITRLKYESFQNEPLMANADEGSESLIASYPDVNDDVGDNTQAACPTSAPRTIE